jgi:beta-galactosidase
MIFLRLLVAFALGLLLSGLTAFSAGSDQSPRERLLLDFGWKFRMGNEWGSALNLTKAGYSGGPAAPGFSDASWRTVNLPHDWANELPFDPRASEWQGFKAIGRGFSQNSEGWYRRTFVLSKSDAGKRLWVEFDGVFRNCAVFLNGWVLGTHESGYSSFRLDITDLAEVGGTNVLAVRVDANEPEGWFYEGAGIYRHVWLVKTAPLAVVPDGTFVFSKFKDNTPKGAVDIHSRLRLVNSQGATGAVVRFDIENADGRTVRSSKRSLRLAGWEEQEIEQIMRVASPVLWSPEAPYLYRLIAVIESGGTVVDRTETEFGIRTVEFDKDKGFLLNGRPYVIKGTCNHQDHAGVGVALPDRLQYFRIEKLKAMGANAFRIGHHPPTPELLEACDRLGMLVLNEHRLLGSDGVNLAELGNLILRDRNHPSVIAWSLGNEEWVQTSGVSARVGETMQRLVKELDPTRPVTYASHTGDTPGINQIIEVRGWNYTLKEIDSYRKTHANQPNLGTEQSSATSTRGVYSADKTRGYVSAYDTNYPGWGSSAERWWTFFSERPWLSGGFVWTGFDYRGEPTPYGWPCISSHFGLMDTCGFPKDNYFYYQSWWTDQPVLHLLPHWNWQGREGEEIDVRCFSNCEEVELFLNGRSLGRQTMKRNSHLRWNVKYAPGTLSAKGYSRGRPAIDTTVETTSAPAAIRLEPDRVEIRADGDDLSVVTVAVTDIQGRVARLPRLLLGIGSARVREIQQEVVPTATNLIEFELEGPGRIIGVGNGDPSCHESDVYVPEPLTRLVQLNDWRWKPGVDARKAGIREYGEEFDDSAWEKIDVNSELGPLEGDTRGVFRTKVDLAEQDIASRSVEVRLNSVDDWCWVYVNGQKAGESRDANVPLYFDIKRFLRKGENTIAVGVMNIRARGGINKGVALVLQSEPEPVKWRRSVFNGLAQIIVQSVKQAGEIKLTARGDGLSAGTAKIQSLPHDSRPAVQ